MAAFFFLYIATALSISAMEKKKSDKNSAVSSVMNEWIPLMLLEEDIVFVFA